MSICVNALTGALAEYALETGSLQRQQYSIQKRPATRYETSMQTYTEVAGTTQLAKCCGVAFLLTSNHV